MFLYATMEGLARRDRPEGKLDEGLLPRVGQGDTSALEALYVTVDEITRRLPEAIGILNPPASGTPQETP